MKDDNKILVLLGLLGFGAYSYFKSKKSTVKEPQEDKEPQETLEIKDAMSDKVESIPIKDGVNIIKQVFLSFMPEDNIENLRKFKNENADALKKLKSLDANAFGEVSTAFLEKANKFKTQQ